SSSRDALKGLSEGANAGESSSSAGVRLPSAALRGPCQPLAALLAGPFAGVALAFGALAFGALAVFFAVGFDVDFAAVGFAAALGAAFAAALGAASASAASARVVLLSAARALPAAVCAPFALPALP